MNVLMSGATGLVGTALSKELTRQGHTVTRLSRGTAKPGEISWDPLGGKLDPAALNGIDAVVHLAGESVTGRWTAAKKKAIRESREIGTRTLADALAKMAVKPKVFISASATGYYGIRGDDIMTEDSAPGTAFLSDVCKAWEAAAIPARDAGIRTVWIRIGIVISEKGGALKKMLTPFKLGVGGVLGNGKQWMSWIAIEDLVSAIIFCINTESVRGPVNMVAPKPVTNREFTKTLGKVLSRPTIFPLPAFIARLMFGEMADELLLGSTRVEPNRLKEAGYAFEFVELEPALRNALKK